jgi:hypothetical protein
MKVDMIGEESVHTLLTQYTGQVKENSTVYFDKNLFAGTFCTGRKDIFWRVTWLL